MRRASAEEVYQLLGVLPMFGLELFTHFLWKLWIYYVWPSISVLVVAHEQRLKISKNGFHSIFGILEFRGRFGNFPNWKNVAVDVPEENWLLGGGGLVLKVLKIHHIQVRPVKSCQHVRSDKAQKCSDKRKVLIGGDKRCHKNKFNYN